ncbi:hypothetical protein HPB48_015383 [Haemaphysalis longicornis]|uniref:Uracil phosphoribosyltransferase homolog n=1 Tax=Haemaphysalis longicornis TaxID=44386 RepID=A0A9J6H4D5_HAELO|nr:hypothetical protein HPB48_015383 [Haemaphysalis longicornis]
MSSAPQQPNQAANQPDVVRNVSPRNALSINQEQHRFGRNLKIMPTNDQIKELQTIIRDKTTTRGEFVFYADRLIRLVVEEGLNQLSYTECTVTTPTGSLYNGIKFLRGSCGVSIIRSGEAMEQGLRDCCRSIRIGKILIQSDEDTHEASVVYAKFPVDVNSRKVLLMYPIMSTGNTVNKAVQVLKDHGVREDNIFLLNLFCTPHVVARLQFFKRSGGHVWSLGQSPSEDMCHLNANMRTANSRTASIVPLKPPDITVMAHFFCDREDACLESCWGEFFLRVYVMN